MGGVVANDTSFEIRLIGPDRAGAGLRRCWDTHILYFTFWNLPFNKLFSDFALCSAIGPWWGMVIIVRSIGRSIAVDWSENGNRCPCLRVHPHPCPHCRGWILFPEPECVDEVSELSVRSFWIEFFIVVHISLSPHFFTPLLSFVHSIVGFCSSAPNSLLLIY